MVGREDDGEQLQLPVEFEGVAAGPPGWPAGGWVGDTRLSRVRPLSRLLALSLVLTLSATASADPSTEARIEEARAHARRGDVESQLSLVIVLVESGREYSRAALQELELLDAIAPHDRRARYWRARVLSSLGQREAAEQELRDARTARSLTLRGQLRAERGARSLALADFRRALSSSPSIELELNVARLAERLLLPELAFEVLERATRRTPSALIRAEAAQVAARAGHHERALYHVRELLVAAPTVQSHLLEAQILADAGRSVEARAAIARARARADRRVARRTTAMTLTERARVFVAAGQLDAARRDLEQAVRLSPSWLTARRLLSQVASAVPSPEPRAHPPTSRAAIRGER